MLTPITRPDERPVKDVELVKLPEKRCIFANFGAPHGFGAVFTRTSSIRTSNPNIESRV